MKIVSPNRTLPLRNTLDCITPVPTILQDRNRLQNLTSDKTSSKIIHVIFIDTKEKQIKKHVEKSKSNFLPALPCTNLSKNTPIINRESLPPKKKLPEQSDHTTLPHTNTKIIPIPKNIPKNESRKKYTVLVLPLSTVVPRM